MSKNILPPIPEGHVRCAWCKSEFPVFMSDIHKEKDCPSYHPVITNLLAINIGVSFVVKRQKK